MYNVSTVSINESFAPLLGVDMTFNSGLSAKLEYKKTRSLNLSMTSVALTENYSNDIVVGFGYKIKDLNLFGAKKIQAPKNSHRRQVPVPLRHVRLATTSICVVSSLIVCRMR